MNKPIQDREVPLDRTATFSVSSALLEELGERLVSKPEVALAELIKNAYDADASKCHISFEKDFIEIEDDGHGMTEDEFLKHWMVISSQQKGILRFSRHFRRKMAGSKGIGRFSARFLGSVVELTTVAIERGNKFSLRAVFDWKKIMKTAELTTVSVKYGLQSVSSGLPTGTKLRITSLRDSSRSFSVASVKSDVVRLTEPTAGLEAPPFAWKRPIRKSQKSDPGFSVTIGESSAELTGADVGNANIQAEILKAFVGRVRLHVDEVGRLKYEVFWKGSEDPVASKSISLRDAVGAYTFAKLRASRGKFGDSRGLVQEVSEIRYLPLATQLNTPVFIDLRFFPKRKGTFEGAAVNGTTAHAWIRDHASFAVVDNNFLVAAYATEASDWLGIDASKAVNQRDWQSVLTPKFYPMDPEDKADEARNPMLALPRQQQLVGRIHVATSKSSENPDSANDDWLQPNMDRESFRANGAFNLLWHLARFSAELIAHFDRATRLEAEKKERSRERKSARAALSQAIVEIKTSDNIEPRHRKRIVEQLEGAQERILDSERYERDARFSLEIMAMMGIVAGFMTHEFEKAVHSLREAALTLTKLAKSHPSLSEHAEGLGHRERKLGQYMEYMRAFVNRAKHPEPQKFKARAQLLYATGTLEEVAREHDVSIEIDADPKVDGPFVPVAAYHGIVINLVSNSLKALVQTTLKSKRRVLLKVTSEDGLHILECSDNGIGIPEFIRDRIWDPLFTTTGDGDENPLGSGLGLGLNVVRRVVSNLHGTIRLLEGKDIPEGFTTSFRLTLPASSGTKSS